MICLEAQYFNLNRILLRAIGCWPFQQSKFARIQFCFFFSIMIANVIFQLTSFATSKCTTNFVLKVLFSVFISISIDIYYSTFYINIEIVKNLLAELHYICNQLKDENEIAIIKKYGYRGKYVTAAFTAISISLMSGFLVSQFYPSILNIILHTNKSRSRRLHYIKVEYFLDEEKYFYLILLHISIAICLRVIALIAIGTMFITYFQHTCGMFRIASYRIEYAVGVNILRNIPLKNEHLVYKEIVCGVNIHQQATRLSKLLLCNFDTTYFFLVIIAVILLSLSLFQIAISKNNIPIMLIAALIAFSIIIIFFLGNYMGQLITDHNKHVFVTVYNVQWYIYPLHIQKLMLFLLQKGVKELHLTCGGLFIASFECFATLIKTSGSYFTVIYSMQ